MENLEFLRNIETISTCVLILTVIAVIRLGVDCLDGLTNYIKLIFRRK